MQRMLSANIANSAILSRKIGSTTYVVSVYSKQNAKESLKEKIARLIKNDLQLRKNCGIMEILQAGCLSERSST